MRWPGVDGDRGTHMDISWRHGDFLIGKRLSLVKARRDDIYRPATWTETILGFPRQNHKRVAAGLVKLERDLRGQTLCLRAVCNEATVLVERRSW